MKQQSSRTTTQSATVSSSPTSVDPTDRVTILEQAAQHYAECISQVQQLQPAIQQEQIENQLLARETITLRHKEEKNPSSPLH